MTKRLLIYGMALLLLGLGFTATRGMVNAQDDCEIDLAEAQDALDEAQALADDGELDEALDLIAAVSADLKSLLASCDLGGGIVGGPTPPPDSPLLPEGVLTRYNGIPQGQIDLGVYEIGDPDAPVRLEIFSSFACPPCASFNQSVTTSDELLELVRAGDVVLFFIPYYITGHIPNGEDAARAAVCAGNQGKFWQMQEMLFFWQVEFEEDAFTEENIFEGADLLRLDLDAFEDCLDDDATDEALAAAIEAGQDARINSTPSVFVNGDAVDPPTPDNVFDAIEDEL